MRQRALPFIRNRSGWTAGKLWTAAKWRIHVWTSSRSQQRGSAMYNFKKWTKKLWWLQRSKFRCQISGHLNPYLKVNRGNLHKYDWLPMIVDDFHWLSWKISGRICRWNILLWRSWRPHFHRKQYAKIRDCFSLDGQTRDVPIPYDVNLTFLFLLDLECVLYSLELEARLTENSVKNLVVCIVVANGVWIDRVRVKEVQGGVALQFGADDSGGGNWPDGQ